MKKTQDELMAFQAVCFDRIAREKAENRKTKLSGAMKRMIGDPGNHIKGTLFEYSSDYNDRVADIRRNHASTDKEKNILTDIVPGANGMPQTFYKYTVENDKKVFKEIKNLGKETVTLNEKDLVMVTELPDDLTDGEIYHGLGMLFTQGTLDAWQAAKEKQDAEAAAKTKPEAQTHA